MKKLLLFAIILLMSFDSVDAQMAFEPNRTVSDRFEFSALDSDDLNDFAKKRRRKRRKKGRRGGGRGGSDLSTVAGVNFGLGMPFGDLGDAVKMGFGGGVEFMYFVQPSLGIGLNTGYYTFSMKEVSVAGLASATGSWAVVPIMPQIRYLLGSSDFKPYLGLDVGMFMEMINQQTTVKQVIAFDPITFEPIYEDVTVDEKDSKMNFGLAPVAGFMYGLSDNLLLNINLKYNLDFSNKEEFDANLNIVKVNQTYSFLGINLGAVFNF